jgi:hypothetical protein
MYEVLMAVIFVLMFSAYGKRLRVAVVVDPETARVEVCWN